MKKKIVEKYSGPHKPQKGVDTNKLRAAVLGANDGIISVASIVVGVAGATSSSVQIVTAGIAGLVAGAISMGLGEYVSVSSQRDTERILLEKQRSFIAAFPEEKLKEQELLYKAKGLSEKTARLVAKELSVYDAEAAHHDAEVGIDLDVLTNPWNAAIASSLAFTAGAIVPLISIAIVSTGLRVPITIIAVLFALIATGLLSARASGASKLRSTRRVVVGGLIAMTVTYAIGNFVGHVSIG